jgi:hypothetical protein
MRVLPGYSIALLLALLLVGTTPVGAGVGIHRFDLLHPLFSHVHVVNGRVLTHEQIQRGDTGSRPASPGPSVGAATGAAAAEGDLGMVTTDQPIEPLNVVVVWDTARIDWLVRLPLDRREAPPDPPPLFSASTA